MSDQPDRRAVLQASAAAAAMALDQHMLKPLVLAVISSLFVCVFLAGKTDAQNLAPPGSLELGVLPSVILSDGSTAAEAIERRLPKTHLTEASIAYIHEGKSLGRTATRFNNDS